MRNITKPQAHQQPDWGSVYIDKLPEDGMVMQHLLNGQQELFSLIREFSDEQLLFAYAEGKWTIKESLVHLMDAERVFAYRALAMARNDKTPLPGFDHNAYVPNSFANDRTKDSLLNEYRELRNSTLAFFHGLADEALDQVGEANGQPFSARALVYMIAGHERHHIALLRERYIPAM